MTRPLLGTPGKAPQILGVGCLGGPGLPPSSTVTEELFLRSLSWPCPAGIGMPRVCEVLPPGAC